MATIALIQNQFSVLNAPNAKRLSGFEKQLYTKFFETLVDESGHAIQTAKTLKDYQAESFDTPDIIICTPFNEVGNLAPGFADLARIMQAFPGKPVVVWSTREEEVVRVTVLEDHKAAAYYTGTLLDAPDDFADLVLEHT